MTTDPYPSVRDAVRDAVCVPAQDAPLARFSLGLRNGVDDVAVRAAFDTGDVVRTRRGTPSPPPT
ncbi:MAG: hypothetical protein M3487_10125 [Actinomycetota bacterium]|nr:hypothetical protein [Actinomycetota bacterium]